MKTYTEAEGRAAIEVAKRIAIAAKETAIVRLFAIAQVYYLQPVGKEACKELETMIGVKETAALFFIAGFSMAGDRSQEQWARLACIPPSPVTSH